MRSGAKAALYFLLGVGVLAALVAYVRPAEVGKAVSRANPIYLLLAFATYAAFFVLRGVRWKVLFSRSAPDVRLASTTSTTAVGWLANSILPFKGGDVLRAALLTKREKLALATTAATVGLERVLDLVGLAIVAAAGLLLLPRAAHLSGGLERALLIVWILPLVAILVLAILVRWRDATVRFAGWLMKPFGKIGQKLVRFGDTVLAGLGALGSSRSLLLALVPLTLLVAVSQALIFAWLVLAFLPGVTFALAFAGSSIFLLSFVVSITPGNVGTYEAAFSAVFVGLGAAPEMAVPAGILTHIATTLTVAILGGLGLFLLGTKHAIAVRDPSP